MELREKIAREIHEANRKPIVEYALARGIKTEEELTAQRPPWDDELKWMKAQYLAMADRILSLPEIKEALALIPVKTIIHNDGSIEWIKPGDPPKTDYRRSPNLDHSISTGTRK